MCVRSGGVNSTCPASCEDRRLGLYVDRLACLDANGNDTDYRTVLILDQVDGKPLVEEHRLVLDVVLVERVQQGMSGPVCRGTGSCGLTAFTIVF